MGKRACEVTGTQCELTVLTYLLEMPTDPVLVIFLFLIYSPPQSKVHPRNLDVTLRQVVRMPRYSLRIIRDIIEFRKKMRELTMFANLLTNCGGLRLLTNCCVILQTLKTTKTYEKLQRCLNLPWRLNIWRKPMNLTKW